MSPLLLRCLVCAILTVLLLYLGLPVDAVRELVACGPRVEASVD